MKIFIQADPCLDPALVSMSVWMAGVSQDVRVVYRKVLKPLKLHTEEASVQKHCKQDDISIFLFSNSASKSLSFFF